MSLEKRKFIYLTGQGSAEKRIRIMEDEENSDKKVENMSTDCENTLEKERTSVSKSYSKTRFSSTTLGDHTWEIDQFRGFDEIKNTITFPSFPEIGQCEILMKTFKDTLWDNNTLKEIRFYILTNNSFGGSCTTTVAQLSGHVSSKSISGCISNMALLIVVKSEKLSHENTLIIRCKFEIFRNLIYKNMHMNLRPPLTEISKDFEDSTFDNFSSKDEKSIKFVVGEKTYVISRTLLYDTKSRYFQNIALNKAIKIYNTNNTLTKSELQAFKQILLYIITGSIEQCDYDMLKNLLTAANKYDLPILKLKCEHNLLHYIMTENAVELIQLAFSSNAKFLETNSATFIKFHRKEITDTDKFQSLSQEDLNKIMELIEEIQIDPVSRTYQLSLPLVKYKKFRLSENTTKT